MGESLHSHRNNYSSSNNNIPGLDPPLGGWREEGEGVALAQMLTLTWGTEKCRKWSFKSNLKCVSSYYVVHEGRWDI